MSNDYDVQSFLSFSQWRKLIEIIALLLQSLKDFVSNRCVILGCGAVIGASAVFKVCNSKWMRKKRPMSSYPNLGDNTTIMGRLLTPDHEIFSKVKDKRTSRGYDIDKLIESGVFYHSTTNQRIRSARESLMENSTGLLAGDNECYDLFSELIDPVISEMHQIDQMKSLSSEVNLNWKEIKGGNFYGANVLSCCTLSTSRNIQGYRMIPGCAPAELLEVGHVVVNALKGVEGKANYMKYSASELFFFFAFWQCHIYNHDHQQEQ